MTPFRLCCVLLPATVLSILTPEECWKKLSHAEANVANLAEECDVNMAPLEKKQLSLLAAHAATGRTDVVQALLAAGATVDAQYTIEGTGATALIMASLNRREDVVRELLKHNPDVNLRDNRGDSALYKLVVKRGKDAAERNKEYRSSFEQREAIAWMLLARGADPTFRCSDNTSDVVALLLEYGDTEMLDLLVEKSRQAEWVQQRAIELFQTASLPTASKTWVQNLLELETGELGLAESDILVNVGGNRFTNRNGLIYVADSNKLVSFAKGSTGGRIDDVAQVVLPLQTDETRDVGVLQTRRVGRKVSFSLQGSARKKAVTLLLRLSFAGFAGVDWNDRTAKAAARANKYALNIQVVGGDRCTSLPFNGGDTVTDLVAHVAAPKNGKQFTIELTATKICDGEECGVAEVSLCSLIVRPEASILDSCALNLGGSFRVQTGVVEDPAPSRKDTKTRQQPVTRRTAISGETFCVNVGGDEFTDMHKGMTCRGDLDANIFDAAFSGEVDLASHAVLPPVNEPFFPETLFMSRRVGREFRMTLSPTFTETMNITLRFSEAGFQPPDELVRMKCRSLVDSRWQVDWQDTAEVAARRKKKNTVHVRTAYTP